MGAAIAAAGSVIGLGSAGGSSPSSTVGNITDSLGLTNHAGERALEAQTNAARDANATQLYMYNTNRADNMPWMQAGQGALSQLASGDVFGKYEMYKGEDGQQHYRQVAGGGFQADPGYEFRMKEGQKAIDAAASARGMYGSGATLKSLARYAQDYGSNEYNNAYNRQFNRLSALAGFGQQGTAQTQASGQNYANNVSANQIGVGNAAAASQTAAANRFNGLLSQGIGIGAGLAFSDERLKTDIKEIPKHDLDEMKKHLKAFYFKYKSNNYGLGEWSGVMAQDLEKSKLGKTLVTHDEAGNKMIDLKKVLSMFLATMAEG